MKLTKQERAAKNAAIEAAANEALAALPEAILGEARSRRVTLAQLEASYGPSPSDARIELVATTAKATRMAITLPQYDNMPLADALAECLALIDRTKYASFTAKGVGPKQIGKRTEAQEKALSAATTWLSTALGDIGRGVGKTTAQKNADAKKAREAKEKAEAERLAKKNLELDIKAGRAPHQNSGGPNARDAANDATPAPIKGKWTVERFAKHMQQTGASLLAAFNALQKDTGGATPPALASLVQDVKAMIDAGVKPYL